MTDEISRLAERLALEAPPALSRWDAAAVEALAQRTLGHRLVTSVISFDPDGKVREYAGGYSDMAAQRRDSKSIAPEVKREKKTKSSVKTKNPTGNKKRKLSFKEKHALETLPKEMEVLHADIDRLHDLLSDPDLYGRDAAAYEQATVSLRAAEQRLDAAEEEWLELEMLREEIEGA